MKKYLDDYFADGKALINAGFSLRDAARILRLTCPFDITQVGWEKRLSR